MLDQKIVALLNEQINKEFYSAYLYLEIHAYYVDKDLNGFGNWFLVQAQEERDHAMLFFKYLQNNDVKPQLFEIKAPEVSFSDFREPAQQAYEHEQGVTASINNIYAAAFELRDFRTMQLLDWFVKEQNEEEKNTQSLIKKYDLFGGDAKALYMLDNELVARVYAPPSLVL
jgi:ferritin